jgi:hypothetical protein
MDIPESKVHSFIVKLWMEDADEPERAVWHGYITHVPDGTRFYLKDLGDIVSFIRPYFPEMSADTPSLRRRSWLKPWSRRKQ